MAMRYNLRKRFRTLGVIVERAPENAISRPISPERVFTTISSRQPSPVSKKYTCHSAPFFATARAGSLLQRRRCFSQTTEQALAQELETAMNVVKSEDTIPSEEAVQRALRKCEILARSFAEPIVPPEKVPGPDESPTTNLLSLDERSQVSMPSSLQEKTSRRPIEPDVADKISSIVYSIIIDPKVFITPSLLATYIRTQSVLCRPRSFPQIFDLYTSKPIPQLATLPITYKDPNPKRASSAVPLNLAGSALTAAIEAKDLPLCLSIIDTSVCTTAFKRSKVLRRALLPMLGLTFAPAAAYVLADRLAHYQHLMDHQLATNMAFTGILTYVGCTATIGYVAVTTANDHMDRITWALGTPLRERWLREEERALIDRVAGAWGFQDVNRRGEEEGEEWEAFREWVLMRGMVLDNPELMEGME